MFEDQFMKTIIQLFLEYVSIMFSQPIYTFVLPLNLNHRFQL
jgi:hypothetical protein